MVQNFTDVFGDMLARPPKDGPGILPSPWALRGKVLLKGKRLEPDGTFVDETHDEDDDPDVESSSDSESEDDGDDSMAAARRVSEEVAHRREQELGSGPITGPSESSSARMDKFSDSARKRNLGVKVIPELSAITYLTTTIKLNYKVSPWVYTRVRIVSLFEIAVTWFLPPDSLPVLLFRVVF